MQREIPGWVEGRDGPGVRLLGRELRLRRRRERRCVAALSDKLALRGRG